MRKIDYHLDKYSADITPWASWEFTLKYLGLKIKLPENAFIRYNLDYKISDSIYVGEKPDSIGKTTKELKGDKYFTEIINPSLWDVENYFNSKGLETIVLREHICAHEEAHAISILALADQSLFEIVNNNNCLIDNKTKIRLLKLVGFDFSTTPLNKIIDPISSFLILNELLADITAGLHVVKKFKSIDKYKIYKQFLQDCFKGYSMYTKYNNNVVSSSYDPKHVKRNFNWLLKSFGYTLD